jgi:hypothetical protein
LSPLRRLQLQPELKGPFWAREFAVAHREIDDDYSGNVNGKAARKRRRRLSYPNRDTVDSK